ncbi:AraC family transcriptional regulator [Larkinella harenae]
MTNSGELMTREGEIKNNGLSPINSTETIRQNSVFLGRDKDKIVEKSETYLREDAEGASYEFISAGIHIWYATIQPKKRIKSQLLISSPCIQLLFSIQSVSSYRFKFDKNSVYKFSDQEHNILLFPDDYVYFESKVSDQLEFFSISLSPELFFSYFPDSITYFSGFRETIKTKKTALFSEHNLSITPRIAVILQEIIHCSLGGYSKRLYIEAKVIELVALQIDQYERIKNAPLVLRLKEEEVQKMHRVRQIITENPEKTFSLKDLSREVGTNEYNLKKHFKQLFGDTVFGYIQNFRMEKAKAMLAERNAKIAEVGRQLGYKHATHFTTAFKKYYGFLPHKLKAFLLVDLVEFDLTLLLEVL